MKLITFVWLVLSRSIRIANLWIKFLCRKSRLFIRFLLSNWNQIDYIFNEKKNSWRQTDQSDRFVIRYNILKSYNTSISKPVIFFSARWHIDEKSDCFDRLTLVAVCKGATRDAGQKQKLFVPSSGLSHHETAPSFIMWRLWCVQSFMGICQSRHLIMFRLLFGSPFVRK